MKNRLMMTWMMMIGLHSRKLRLLSAVILCIAGPQHLDAAIIHLKPQCTCTKSVVLLSDIAEIWDANSDTAVRLRNSQLIPAPAAGRKAHLQLAAIKTRLQALGENLAQLEFRGAASVTIDTPSMETVPDRAQVGRGHQHAQRKLTTALQRYLDQHQRGTKVSQVEVPQTRQDMRAIISSAATMWGISTGRPSPTGSQLFVIRIRTPQGNEQMIEIQAQLTPLPLMLVLRHAVPKEYRIEHGDLEWKQVYELPQNQAILNRPDDVIGRETTRVLPRGQAIKPGDVRSTPLIRRGDLVTVYSRSGGITVSTVAKSRSEGAYGKQVTLTMVAGRRRTILARVIGYHIAEITDESTQSSARINRAQNDRALIIMNEKTRPRSNAGRRAAANSTHPTIR